MPPNQGQSQGSNIVRGQVAALLWLKIDELINIIVAYDV